MLKSQVNYSFSINQSQGDESSWQPISILCWSLRQPATGFSLKHHHCHNTRDLEIPAAQPICFAQPAKVGAVQRFKTGVQSLLPRRG